MNPQLGSGGRAKFDQYTIPGGENYRELLLKTPKGSAESAQEHLLRKGYYANVDELMEDTGGDLASIEEAAFDTGWKPGHGKGDFKSSHWDEPNVLSHIRFSDRTDEAGKKVLHIEEIQSDWHQAGRKKGYSDPRTVSQQDLEDYVRRRYGDEHGEILTDEQVRGIVDRNRDTITQDIGRFKIPDAPFKKSWPTLSMKRMIRYAAENGYDRVAWTPGAEQAARYDLSKQVKDVVFTPDASFNPASGGGGHLIVNGLDGDTIVSKPVKTEELTDYIGKEAAEKLLAQPLTNRSHRLAGEGLSVGGEGMKGFYDQILPAETNKLIKKWGGRVGKTKIRAISDEAAEYGLEDVDFASFDELRTSGHLDDTFPGRDLHAFDITPAMKEEVLGQGQSLYQMGQQGAKGAVDFAQNGKATIHAFQAADVSTHLHELSHIMRRNLTVDDQKIADAFVGATGGPWSVAQEEQFARGFERYVREGAAPNSALGQLYEKLKKWMVSIYQSIAGSPIAGQLTPEIRELYGRLAGGAGGIPLDDKRATELLSEVLYATEASTSYGAHQQHLANPHGGSSLQDVYRQIPGQRPFSARQIAKRGLGLSGDTTLNPFKGELEGITFTGKEPPEKDTFAIAAAGGDANAWVESVVRGAPMLTLLRQGVDPVEAIRRVNEAQVAYQPRFYTKTEQQALARLFQFYRYTKGQIPFTLRMLSEEPGGRLAQTLRGINSFRGEDELTPDYIQETASIPLGQKPDGSQSYLTGLGLNFEDPLSFATPSAQGIGMELGSRLNLPLKGLIEGTTGTSFFQRAPHGGGRLLEDMDPVLGRLLANIGQGTGLRDENNKAPVRFPGSGTVEHLLSNSPLSMPLGLARTATDSRKGPLHKAVQIGTGLRISDISPQTQDRVLRDRIGLIEKRLGGRSFSGTYVPAETKAKMSEKDKAILESLEQMKKLLDARSKGRRESPQAASK
jgi:hypothetical protein